MPLDDGDRLLCSRRLLPIRRVVVNATSMRSQAFAILYVFATSTIPLCTVTHWFQEIDFIAERTEGTARSHESAW
jgi:hypothetical protein